MACVRIKIKKIDFFKPVAGFYKSFTVARMARRVAGKRSYVRDFTFA